VAGRLWRVARRHPGITAVTTTAAATILAIATFAYVRVVAERDEARRANGKTEQALEQARESNRKEQAAIKQSLVNTVEVVAQSASPNRRRQGLGLIEEAVSLQPEAELRPKLRDEAVKFLVLREVEDHKPELPTGRTHGLVFGPTGHRLVVISEDEDELSFWDVGRRQHQRTFPLRVGSAISMAGDVPASDGAAGEKIEIGPAGASASRANRAASPALPAANRRGSTWFASQRLAQSGPLIAALLPDERGLALVDLDPVPGAPPRILSIPNHAMLSVVADPGGKRLVTVEQVIEDPLAGLDGFPADSGPNDFQVNLWDPDHLDRPVAKLQWTRPGLSGRPQFPLVAISLDGSTVAVAANRRYVRLFSSADGRQLIRAGGRADGRPPGRNEGRNEARSEPLEIDTQTDLSALTLGPNDTLATAGTAAGNVVIKIWNWADPRNVPTSLMPLYQNFTRVMRFSPKGTLLAIAGAGPIELWDPLAHSLVAVLRTNDQATDLAFAPDGRTLAAGGRSALTSVWTVNDSAARTQLSGFDTPTSLAFNAEGVLAGVGWRSEVWYWRDGRCPEVGLPAPSAMGTTVSGTARAADPKRPEAPDREPVRKNEPERRGGGGRPPGRGSMSSPPTLSFDALDRLLLHDARGLKVWPAGPSSAQTPPVL
jgi:WD40 repeat protein